MTWPPRTVQYQSRIAAIRLVWYTTWASLVGGMVTLLPAALSHRLFAAQARVEGVAQTIAEQVEGQAGQGQSKARECAHPEGLADHVLAAGDHVAPRGHVRRHAHAEKAQDRLGEHGV